MQRLYFLIPDVAGARRLVDDLLLAGIEERHIHLVARDHLPLERAHLPEATPEQETDFVPYLEKGAAAGGASGLLAGIIAVTFPPAGLILGGGAIVGIGLLGAGLGALLAGWIGSRVPNHELDAYAGAIQQGQILMLVDVPGERAAAVEEIILWHRQGWNAPSPDAAGTPPQ